MISEREIQQQRWIESIQKNLDMPLCFELSREKLRDQATIEMLINRITTNTLRAGDQFALLEIIKDWLAFTEKPTTAEEKSGFPITSLNPATVYLSDSNPFNSPES